MNTSQGDRAGYARRVRGSSARILSLFILIVAIATAALTAQGASARPAMPVDPMAAIINAFRSHAVVTLDSHHGNEQVNAFAIALIRNPRIAATVRDIVVEFGTAKHQDVIDRFVEGQDVTPAVLRTVWQDAVITSAVWDSPLTEQFFRAVRDLNVTRPRGRRMRVWLGDPPIDWSAVHTRDDFMTWVRQRDTYPGELIRREILEKHRPVLVLYGQMHAQRKDLLANYEQGDGLFNLEAGGKTHVFSIWSAVDDSDLTRIQADVAKWPVPSLALLRGTVLGAADFTAYYPYQVPRFDVRVGNGAQVPRDRWRSRTMEDQFDALLYLGPQSALTRAHLSPSLCAEPAYVVMRLERMALAGIPQTQAEEFKQNCARIASKN